MSRTVSVVVPTYQRPAMLAETLASVCNQTYADWQVLVCDNANDPATAQVVADLSDDRFTYLGRPENLGMIRSAFDGLRRAEGDLVMELDDDDLLYPRCLEVLVGGFDAGEDVTMTSSDVDLIGVDGMVLEPQSSNYRRVTGRDAMAEGVHRPFVDEAAHGKLNTVSALFRRDAIAWDRLPLQVHTAYDLHLMVEAAADGAATWYAAEPLAGYRIHPGSDSYRGLQAQLEGADFTLRHALASGRYEDTATIDDALRRVDVRLARVYLRAGQRDDCVRLLRRVLGSHNDVEAARLLAVALLPARVRDRILEARHRRQGGDPVMQGAYENQPALAGAQDV